MKAKDIFQYCLACIIVIGEIAMITFLLILWMKGASTTDQAIVNLIYGIAMGYFFASNKGSSEKTEMIHNSTPLVKPNEQT